MASLQPKQFDRTKSDGGANPCRKVQVVAKIRGFSGQEAEFQSGTSKTAGWISVNKPHGEKSESVTISFAEKSSSREESYLLDYCYEENEENEMIYSRDVKPLISAVFEGQNSTIIAYGATGSGKTHLIQGSTERPGLSVLAITEFLSMAEQSGKSVAISFYEVDHQEHAVDLLNPEQPTILVFEDRQRIQFKGLSKITVKSIAEFQRLYYTACAARKASLKKGNERPRKSHMGLIVHVVSHNESTESNNISKMNFVDMAGYEDARKKSGDGSCLAETSKINKSIYALLKVCHALNINESHVPYRESKLTRILQDSLRGTGRILMVACLNPSFCQDTIYMVSLVSRSCQGIYRSSLDFTKKSGSSARQMMPASHKSQILKSVSSTNKNFLGSRSHIYEKKATGVNKSSIKGRKLFDEANHSAKAEKARSLSDMPSTFGTSVQEEDDSLSNAGNHVEPNSRTEKDHPYPDARNHTNHNPMAENEDSFWDARNQVELHATVEKGVSVKSENNEEDHTPSANNYSNALSIVQEGHKIDKENNNLMANEDESLPISIQLRELSNNLKSLCSSTPLCVKIPKERCISFDSQVSANIAEPRTPVIEQNTRVNDRWDMSKCQSPWETFSMRGSGMKNSLVQEYLRFLNTANKEDLKKLKGIGEKRATFILELREESPEPFKSLDDLKDIGLSAKQIKGMMKKEVGELFN